MGHLGIERDFSNQEFEKQQSQINSLIVSLALGVAPELNYYLPNGNNGSTIEIDRQMTMTKAGRIKRTELKLISNSADQISTITVRKNGADSNIEFIVPVANSVNQEDNDLLEFIEGDLISIELSIPIGTGTIVYNLNFLVEYDV